MNREALSRGSTSQVLERQRAERRLSVMREAACRLKPLARRAITESGESGDQARRDLHEVIDWLARGCPQEAPDAR